MNPFRGSRALLFSVLIPIMLPQVIPEPLRWIWLTLVAFVVLKRLGIIRIGFASSESSDENETQASMKPSISRRDNATHRGEVVAHGSAPYQFNEANRLSYYITLRSERGEDKTIWGIDLKRVALETLLAVGDAVALEFLGREAVVVKEPIRNNQGQVVDHRRVNTHRHTWKARVLPA